MKDVNQRNCDSKDFNEGDSVKTTDWNQEIKPVNQTKDIIPDEVPRKDGPGGEGSNCKKN